MAAQTPLAFEPVHQLRDRLTKGDHPGSNRRGLPGPHRPL